MSACDLSISIYDYEIEYHERESENVLGGVRGDERLPVVVGALLRVLHNPLNSPECSRGKLGF